MSTFDVMFAAAFGLGGPEMIWIFLLLLLLFGAKKLPQLARGIGQSLGEFKKAKEEFESEIRNAEVDIETPKVRAPREPRLEVSTAPHDDHHGSPDEEGHPAVAASETGETAEFATAAASPSASEADAPEKASTPS